MLNPELDPHPVLGTLLDSERGLSELVDGTGLAKVDHDIGTSADEEGELENYDLQSHSQSATLVETVQCTSRVSAGWMQAPAAATMDAGEGRPYRAFITRLSNRASSCSCADTERLLPASEGFIFSICNSIGTGSAVDSVDDRHLVRVSGVGAESGGGLFRGWRRRTKVCVLGDRLLLANLIPERAGN